MYLFLSFCLYLSFLSLFFFLLSLYLIVCDRNLQDYLKRIHLLHRQFLGICLHSLFFGKYDSFFFFYLLPIPLYLFFIISFWSLLSLFLSCSLFFPILVLLKVGNVALICVADATSTSAQKFDLAVAFMIFFQVFRSFFFQFTILKMYLIFLFLSSYYTLPLLLQLLSNLPNK